MFVINITDKRPDQHLKTKQSKRRVPIHPVLKQLGFMEQVNFAKKQKQVPYKFPNWKINIIFIQKLKNAIKIRCKYILFL